MRNTGVVRTYGQYCPIARGAEIFAERWTPLIIRNLHLGCGSFSEILEGAPGLSRTLLSQRLRQLERLGVVESAPKPDGRGHHYELTSAGHDLFTVCQSLGEWGARWLEIAPENLDPFVALWSMCHALRRDRLPDRRVVIRFDFLARRSAPRDLSTEARSAKVEGGTGRPHRERYWLLIELGDTEICKTNPGLDEDLYITAEAEAFVKWHAGQLTWAQATREGRIQLDGLPSLVRAFPTWNARSMFAHIRPVSPRTANSMPASTADMVASRPSHSACGIRHGAKEDDMNVTLEGTSTLSPMDLSMPRSKAIVIASWGFWTVTALFCLQIGFTAYAQLQPAAGGGGVHPPRLPRLFPGGARVGQAPRRGAVAGAGAGAAQGVGLRRLRHHPRLCAHRPLRGG